MNLDDRVEHGVGDVDNSVLQRGDEIAGCWDADRSDADVREHGTHLVISSSLKT